MLAIYSNLAYFPFKVHSITYWLKIDLKKLSNLATMILKSVLCIVNLKKVPCKDLKYVTFDL